MLMRTSQEICVQWQVVWPVLTGIQVQVSLPKQKLIANMAVAGYRRGWVSSLHTGNVVIEW